MDKVEVKYAIGAVAKGGRNGHSATQDGRLAVDLVPPQALAGNPAAVTPEHLFAAGYAACFSGAVDFVAKQKGITSSAEVVCTVGIGPREGGGFGLTAELKVSDATLDKAKLKELAKEAHETICPYSHATRGNVDVKIVIA